MTSKYFFKSSFRILTTLLAILRRGANFTKSSKAILAIVQYTSSSDDNKLDRRAVSEAFGLLTYQLVLLALAGKRVSKYEQYTISNQRTRTLGQLITDGVFLNSLTGSKDVHKTIPLLCPYALLRYTDLALLSRDARQKSLGKCLQEMLAVEEDFDGQRFERFHACWEVIYRLVLHEEQRLEGASTLEALYDFSDPHEGIGVQNPPRSGRPNQPPPDRAPPAIKFREKSGVRRLAGSQFPPDGGDSFVDEDGRRILEGEQIFDSIFLAPQNNPGFDCVTFERTAEGNCVSVNWENKYSHPATMPSPSTCLSCKTNTTRCSRLTRITSRPIPTPESFTVVHRSGSCTSPTGTSIWSSWPGAPRGCRNTRSALGMSSS